MLLFFVLIHDLLREEALMKDSIVAILRPNLFLASEKTLQRESPGCYVSLSLIGCGFYTGRSTAKRKPLLLF
jgi:hypothetical protein